MMDSGNLAAARMLAKILPEERAIDQIIEALQKMQMGIFTERPIRPMMMLIMKWNDEGKSMEDIFKDSEKVEQTVKMGESIMNSSPN